MCDSQRPLRRVWVFNACLALLAVPLAVVATVFDRPTINPPFTLAPFVGWTLLTLAYWGAERYAVSLSKNGPHLGLGEIALVFGLVLVPAPALIMAKVVGTFLVLTLHRHAPLVKLVFNVGQLVATAAIASLTFDALRHIGTVPSAIGAVLAASTFAFLAVHVVVWLASGRPPDLWRRFQSGVVAAIACACIGLLALDYGGPLLAAFPLIAAYLGFRVAGQRWRLVATT